MIGEISYSSIAGGVEAGRTSCSGLASSSMIRLFLIVDASESLRAEDERHRTALEFV